MQTFKPNVFKHKSSAKNSETKFASTLHVLGVKSEVEIPSKMPLTKEFPLEPQTLHPVCREREKTKSTTSGYFMYTKKKKKKKGSILVIISRIQTEVLHLEERHRAIMPSCHHHLS